MVSFHNCDYCPSLKIRVVLQRHITVSCRYPNVIVNLRLAVFSWRFFAKDRKCLAEKTANVRSGYGEFTLSTKLHV